MASPRVRQARLELLMGVLTFFLVVAVIATLADWFAADPQLWPSFATLALALLLGYAYRTWRRGDRP